MAKELVLDIGGEEVRGLLSAETLVLYEEEFDGADMVKDLYGRQEVRRDDDDPDILMVFDYTQTNWTAVTKSMWAVIRTNDPSLPHYKVWLRGLPDINLVEVQNQLVPAMEDCFFRGRLAGIGQ